MPLNRPPEGFASKWVRHGEIQTRVVGASAFRPILTNDNGHEFASPDHILVVWVETQSLTASNVIVRRWQNPLNDFAAVTTVGGAEIKPAKFKGGARVAGQLETGHKLVPGGPGVIDVLAFEVPDSSARALRLKLDATHVCEGEDFIHWIPYEVWSKK